MLFVRAHVYAMPKRGCRMRACSVGDRRKTTSNVVDQSTRSPYRACASSSVVSLVWVPRARPQTYHFFGDSRRGNILVLVLVLLLASSPSHHEFNKVLTRSSVSKFVSQYALSSSFFPSFYSLVYFTRVIHFLSLVYPRFDSSRIPYPLKFYLRL